MIVVQSYRWPCGLCSITSMACWAFLFCSSGTCIFLALGFQESVACISIRLCRCSCAARCLKTFWPHRRPDMVTSTMAGGQRTPWRGGWRCGARLVDEAEKPQVLSLPSVARGTRVFPGNKRQKLTVSCFLLAMMGR